MNAPDTRLAHSLTQPPWREQSWLQRFGAPLVVPQSATPVPNPHWVARNEDLAQTMGWGAWFSDDNALPLLAGNSSNTVTLATVYSGHQFGVWAGQLGDGRALLLGEADSSQGPQELQLKGSGLTPYSRMGDGRAVLRSSIREYLCSEAMFHLGIPTTRALAVVGSPLPVRRETVETAAVVTRVAPSFLRFGHFEHFTHTAEDLRTLQRLVDATVESFYPELLPEPRPVAALLQAVTLRTARLVAAWQAVGFCHGVMNTDNMSMLGLTIDYGPFGFMDAFDPGHICNHSDHQGRYAYARQPNVALWNLHALAQALLPLLQDSDEALAALQAYHSEFPAAMLGQLRNKLGLQAEHEEDKALADDFLRLMAAGHSDFSITFRRLAQFRTEAGADNSSLRDLFIDRAAFDAWAQRYRSRLLAEGSIDAERAPRMNRVNPKYVLRNHLAQRAIEQAQQGEFGDVRRLLQVLQRPFDEQPEHEADAGFPPEWAQQLEVSCSS
jgi:serine/tyrosine/threonine adenylyltransferase